VKPVRQDAESEDRKLSAEPLARTRLQMNGYNNVQINYLGYIEDRIRLVLIVRSI
jgi:hypothetical protein